MSEWIINDYAERFDEEDDDSTTLKITNATKSPVTVSSTIVEIDASTRTKAVKITGNSRANEIDGGTKADTIYGGAGADEIEGNAGNDKLYGENGDDTLEGGKGADTLTGGDGNDVFVYSAGDGKDVIADYTSGEDYIMLDDDAEVTKSSLSGNDVILTIGNSANTIRLKNAKNKAVTFIDEDGEEIETITYRDTKNWVLSNTDESEITAEADTVTINSSSRTKAIEITGNAKANKILGGSAADTLYGGAGNDSIVGNAGSDKLYGDAGNDTLNGGKGNDTLTGGAGNDVFLYASGEGADVIADYEVGKDKIRITSGAITKSAVSGTDVILAVDSNSITIKGMKGKKLTIINSKGKTETMTIGSETGATITNSTSSPVSYASDKNIINIEAKNRSKDIKITANSNANSINGGSAADTILGGAGADTINGNNGNDKLSGEAGNDKLYGGAGSDSLSGGAGTDLLEGGAGLDTLIGGAGVDTLNGGTDNDTLTGGAGSDVYIYNPGDGHDYITDYASSEKISITSGVYSTLVSSKDVIINVGTDANNLTGSITLKNGKGKKLNIVGEATTVTASSSTTTENAFVEEHWFTEDNNFVTNGSDSIIKGDDLNSIISSNSDITTDNNYSFNIVETMNSSKDNNVTSLTYSQSSKK